MGCGASSNVSAPQPLSSSAHRRPLDDVELGKLLGKGSFALCRKATWGEQTVAVKELRKADKLFDRKLVENEIFIIRRVSHPNCVRLLDVREDPQAVYLIQELLYGGHLGDRICRRTRLCEVEAALISHQLLEAILYLHNSGICHRDLKPENILLESARPLSEGYNKIKITDFGLSFYSDNSSMNGNYPIHNMSSVRGTPQFAAPEVLARASGADIEYDSKIDIYSVGLMLYMMLGGKHPFAYDNADVKVVMGRIMDGRYSISGREFRGVSDDALQFVLRMMELSPEARPDAEECLTNRWMAKTQRGLCSCLQPTLTRRGVDPAKQRQLPESPAIVVEGPASPASPEPTKQLSPLTQLTSPTTDNSSSWGTARYSTVEPAVMPNTAFSGDVKRSQEDFSMQLQVGNDTTTFPQPAEIMNSLIEGIRGVAGSRRRSTHSVRTTSKSGSCSFTESVIYGKDVVETSRRSSCCAGSTSKASRRSSLYAESTKRGSCSNSIASEEANGSRALLSIAAAVEI